MTSTQKSKIKFRSCRKWKDFRHTIYLRQDGLDYISRSKLRKHSSVHHCDLNPAHYEDLSNPDNFYYLLAGMHDVVHYIWTYYKNDKTVLDRLKEVLDRMYELNSN